MLALCGVAAAVGFVVHGGSRAEPHTLRAAFASALQIRPGQDVQVAGRKVGAIRSAKLVDGRAVVEMAIDDKAWPLRRGTTAMLRFGSPLGYAMRYVDLRPGPRAAPPLPDGGVLASGETITPVEFDDVSRVFGPRTRRDLSRLLRNAGRAMDGTGRDLGDFVDGGGQGMPGVADYTSDLAEDPHALRALVTASASVAGQVARNQQRLGPLLRDASDTIDEVVARSANVDRLLAEAPGAFTSGRRVLGHLNRTSVRLERLSRAFAPGAKELRALAPTANRVTTSVATEAPQFADLLRAGVRTLPSLTAFVDRAHRDLPVAGRALSGITDAIACVRPYAPELAGYLSTTSGAHASYDATGHYIRLGLAAYPATTPSTFSPAELTAKFPGLHYAMVRPPGMNADQPWFQPQCGVTPAGLDAARDREAGG